MSMALWLCIRKPDCSEPVTLEEDLVYLLAFDEMLDAFCEKAAVPLVSSYLDVSDLAQDFAADCDDPELLPTERTYHSAAGLRRALSTISSHIMTFAMPEDARHGLQHEIDLVIANCAEGDQCCLLLLS
jgi:hypothetical protein